MAMRPEQVRALIAASAAGGQGFPFIEEEVAAAFPKSGAALDANQLAKMAGPIHAGKPPRAAMAETMAELPPEHMFNQVRRDLQRYGGDLEALYRTQPGFDPTVYDRTLPEAAVDITFGGDSRKANQASYIGGLGNAPTYDPAIDPAFMGLDIAIPGYLAAGRGLEQAGRATSKGADWLKRKADEMPATPPPGSPGAQRGWIGGVNSKTANLDELAQAQEMRAHGKDRDEIFRKTGWMYEEGEWKYENPDINTAMKALDPGAEEMLARGQKYFLPARDYYDNPDLYEAYPELADTHVTLNPGMSITQGSYQPGRGRLRQARAEAGTAAFGDVPDDVYPFLQERTALHEIGGHGVQNIEGFTRGTSPEAQGLTVEPSFVASLDSWNDIMIRAGANPDDLIDKTTLYGYKDADEIAIDIEKQGAWLMDNAGMHEGQVERLADDVFGGNIRDLDTITTPHENYLKNAGEASARNIEYRMQIAKQLKAEGKTDAEIKQYLREHPPWETLAQMRNPVAESDLVFDKAGGGISANTPQRRREVQRILKAKGVPATGKTAELETRARAITKPPESWTRDEFDSVKNSLWVHQDVRGSHTPGTVGAIMDEGLTGGMVDNIGSMDDGKWTWGRGLTGQDAYVFWTGDLNYLYKDAAFLAPGTKPFLHIRPKPGQSLYDAITAQGGGMKALPNPEAKKRRNELDRELQWQALDKASMQAGTKRQKSTGRYIGGGKAVKSPQKKAAIVKQYAQRVQDAIDAGIPPGYFYAQGRVALSAMTESPEKHRLTAELIGPTSTQVGPSENLNYAVRAIDQTKVGHPVSVGIYPNSLRRSVQEAIYDEDPWKGYKVERYRNLLGPEDPRANPLATMPPNDQWEGFGSGLEQGQVPAGATQVAFTDHIRELAMNKVNEKRVAEGLPRLTREEVQELHWAAIRAQTEGRPLVLNPGDTIQGAAEGLTFQHSWEGAPGPSSGFDLGPIEINEYTDALADVLIDIGGRDRLVSAMGGELQKPAVRGTGVYKGETAPGIQSRSLVSQTQARGLSESSRKRVDATEAIRQFILAQEGRAGHSLLPAKRAKDIDTIEVVIGKTPDADQTVQIEDMVNRTIGMDDNGWPRAGIVFTDRGYRILNISDMPNAEFNKKIKGISTSLDGIAEIDDMVGARREGIYAEYNWPKGGVTAKLLFMLNTKKFPGIARMADSPEMREIMRDVADLYDGLKASGLKPNEKLLNVMKTWSTDGLEGVQAMVDKGLAPAAVLGVLAAYEGEQGEQAD